jgi:hypothetical protein
MIKHVVFFQMKNEALGNTAKENAEMLRGRFHEISAQIPGVLSCETGENINAEKTFYDFCLIQAFASPVHLRDYLAHPLHQQLRETVFAVIDHRVVVDYLTAQEG